MSSPVERTAHISPPNRPRTRRPRHAAFNQKHHAGGSISFPATDNVRLTCPSGLDPRSRHLRLCPPVPGEARTETEKAACQPAQRGRWCCLDRNQKGNCVSLASAPRIYSGGSSLSPAGPPVQCLQDGVPRKEGVGSPDTVLSPSRGPRTNLFRPAVRLLVSGRFPFGTQRPFASTTTPLPISYPGSGTSLGIHQHAAARGSAPTKPPSPTRGAEKGSLRVRGATKHHQPPPCPAHLTRQPTLLLDAFDPLDTAHRTTPTPARDPNLPLPVQDLPLTSHL